MSTEEQLDQRISRWLTEEAPAQMPDRVLRATFERTQRVRQRGGVAVVLRSARTNRLTAGFGAAMALAAAVVAFGLYGNQLGITGGPSPTPGASSTPPESPAAVTSPPTGPVWPQSTLEEVRAAQERADGGDPAYAWQLRVDPGQVGQNHPCSGSMTGCWLPARNTGSGEIFIRFLQQKLGWEAFAWDEAFAHRDGLNPGDVIFVRCAPGGTNPLYPTNSGQPGCAPTIDDLRYETVRITVAQPERQGPTGIWVVTGWEMIDPAMQADPRIVEAEATTILGRFLQARIDGSGAETFADFPTDTGLEDELVRLEIPLLYATSSGARYERSQYEIVEGPVWPDGRMRFAARLFAESGGAVVEQHYSLDRDDAGGLRLVYDFAEASEDGPGTTENGEAVPIRYGFLDGLVTYGAAWPLGPNPIEDEDRQEDRLTIGGILPDDDAPRRVLVLVANPRPIGSSHCGDTPAPASAETLAQGIAADPGYDGPGPVAVTIGGRSALLIDGAHAFEISCGIRLEISSSAGGTRARLYLIDLPGGSATVLAISITADLDSFPTVLEWATPVVDSIEFQSP